jgi:hypothetical protein
MQSSGFVIGNGGKITKPAKLLSRKESANSGTCIHGSTSGRIYQEKSSNAWSGPNLPGLSQQTSECRTLQSVRSAAWKVLGNLPADSGQGLIPARFLIREAICRSDVQELGETQHMTIGGWCVKSQTVDNGGRLFVSDTG